MLTWNWSGPIARIQDIFGSTGDCKKLYSENLELPRIAQCPKWLCLAPGKTPPSARGFLGLAAPQLMAVMTVTFLKTSQLC